MNRLLLKNCMLLDKSVRSILIEDGKIAKMDAESAAGEDGVKILDAGEKYVVPGFIDCHTHLGIIEEATGKIGMDNNERSDPITPHLRGIDAINPFDIAFSDAVKSGVTTVMSGPGSDNAVGGLSIALKTSGTIIDRMMIKNPVGLKIALGENPLSAYGISNKCPVTRMGTAALIRELFARAQDYAENKKRNTIKERNLRLEAVLPVLEGKLPVRAHAHRADDIVTALRIAEEFKISRLVIEHGTEAHLIKDYLKEKKVPVAFGPMLTPRIKMELRQRSYRSAVELAEAGVKVALITDHPYNSIDQLRTVTLLTVCEGLNQNEAIRCITVHPAEILDCGDRIGKLQEGYDADLTIFDGNPFDLNSKVVMTLINGNIVFERK